MKSIYDGFMPTSNGATIRQVDVPLIQIPTMTEVSAGTVPARQDGDAPGEQYRLYEFAGMAHVDCRDSVRFQPDSVQVSGQSIPAAGLHVRRAAPSVPVGRQGHVPPRAENPARPQRDNDGSLMALDEHGNPRGGIRNPYVDVPTRIRRPNEARRPADSQPERRRRRPAAGRHSDVRPCGIRDAVFTKDQLKQLYNNKKTYQAQVATRLDELEKPVGRCRSTARRLWPTPPR